MKKIYQLFEMLLDNNDALEVHETLHRYNTRCHQTMVARYTATTTTIQSTTI